MLLELGHTSVGVLAVAEAAWHATAASPCHRSKEQHCLMVVTVR